MMKRYIFSTFLAIILFCNLNAAYIERVPITLIQPNGDTLRCLATGDDFYQWLHDEKNYTIILNVETGFYVYANLVGDQLVPTDLIPGTDRPERSFLTPGLNIPSSKILALRKAMEQPMLLGRSTTESSNKGRMNNIVVFIRLQGDDEYTDPLSSVNQKFNDSSTVESVSIYNYIKNVSYRQMFVQSHYFPKPDGEQIYSYQDSFTRAYYMPYSANNLIGYQNNDTINERRIREHALLARAIEYVKDSIPTNLDLDYNEDGRVDNVSFVVKAQIGDWADLLWPHRWSLYSDSVTINDLRVWDFNFLITHPSYFSAATMSHELLHTLGFPDLYRYDYSGTPIGKWDIMASTTTPPQQTNMYMKWKYGHWIDDIPEITMEGFYTLYPNQSHKEGSVYKIASPISDEYFILEYRKKELPFDATISTGGVVIYRINTLSDGNASTNSEDIFDEVYAYRYGGTIETEGSVNVAAFFQNSNLMNHFNPWSNPNPFLTDGSVCFFELNQFSSNHGDSITFYYNPNPVSVQEHKTVDQSIRIYPIPSTGTVHVQFLNDDFTQTPYSMVDIYGKRVQSGIFTELNNNIDISMLATGIYFMQLKNQQETKTYKIIKN